ncbi:MAG: hypothetical protein D6706_11345 [Chloroflexi bacterium]|nr:MAG: hypothetical protein D6706_11345 [Chloroflexota bacterium]
MNESQVASFYPEPNENLPESSEVSLPRLGKAIESLFTLEELETLCFNLDIKYENIPGETLARKARELVNYFQRRHRLNVLLQALYDERPNYDWQAIRRGPDDPPSVGPDDSAILLSPKADQTSSIIAGKSFTALIRLMREPTVNSAVATFRADFETTSRQISLMNEYKLLHDFFQKLETIYLMLTNEANRLATDESAWDSIELHEAELQSQINDIIRETRQMSLEKSENQWVSQLEKVRDTIHQAVNNLEYDGLKQGLFQLTRILNRQPTRINAQLVAIARVLKLATLEKAIHTICESLTSAGIELKLVAQIEEGMGALSGLESRLNSLVHEHDRWQSIDDELRRVEGVLGESVDDLRFAWEDIYPMTLALCNKQEEWASQIKESCDGLSDALNKTDEKGPVVVRRYFRQYRTRVNHRFRRVDTELLALCLNLQKVGESLDLLLRSLG